MYPHCPILAVQQKTSEEIGARMRAESRVVEVEKQCSMLEFDLKQSVQKMEQLMKQKERLEDEASTPCFNYSYVTGYAFLQHLCLLLHTISFLRCPLTLGEESADTGRAGAK